MSDHLSQPPNAVSGDDADSVVSERGGEASPLDADFCEAMRVIDSRGYLKAYFTLPELARSGLSISRTGDIALPFQEAQARQIIGEAKRSSRANSPWKLDPAQYRLDPGVWAGRLRAIYRNLAPALGRDQKWIDTACARINTVLLIDKGATVDYFFFPAGQEHILVFLPSADFQGGEIVAKVGGQEKTVFSPSKAEEGFASWYPTCKPQLVKSGYALVVAFSLVAVKTTLSASAPLWKDETRATRHVLKRWLSKDVGSRERIALYHPLECNNEKRKPFFQKLTRQDAGRLHALRRLSEKLPFRLYLGHVERDQKKPENSDRFEDIEGGIRITMLLDLNGHLVCENLHLGMADVPEGFFKGMHWESEKQNGPSLTRKGQMKFFAVVPGDAIVSFFIQRGGGENDALVKERIPKVLGEHARFCFSKQTSRNMVPVFEELCMLVWGPPGNSSKGDTKGLFSDQKPEFQNTDLADVLKATILLKWYSWFEKIAAAHAGTLSTTFFGWVPEHFHKDTLKIDTWFAPLEKGLSAAVLAYPRVKQQVRAVETLFPIIMADSGRLISDPPECLIRWARQVLQECIKTCGSKKLARKDGEALAKQSLYFEDPIAVISQVENKIDPGSKPDAYLGFISEIDIIGRYDWISYEKSRELYRKASRTFITSAAFAQMHGEEPEVNPQADFFSRLGDFVFGGAGSRNPMEQFEGGTDNEAMVDSDHEEEEDFMEYMQDGIDSDMDVDEPDLGLGDPNVMDPFGLGVHRHVHNDYKAYREYQEFELNGGRPETEVVESNMHSATLGLWLQQVMRISTRYDDIFSLALARMGEVAPQIPSADFHMLWLPALKGLATKMGRLCLERSKDPNTVLWRKNVYALIKAYLDTYVGQWPRRPGLAQKGVECDCADCKGLNVFLADPTLKTGYLVASKKRCLHVIKVINAGDADVYTECKEIEGQPEEEKLIVTKSRTKMLSRARTAWKERRDEAIKQLGAFDQVNLAALLGPEWMTLFSMVHLGGPSLSDMDMRLALRMKTRRQNVPREPVYIDGSTITMFFGGLPEMGVDEAYVYF
ncbi:hypothetical protein ACQKWADRAFT_326660 [Trichoderma austrokoningii]